MDKPIVIKKFHPDPRLFDQPVLTERDRALQLRVFIRELKAKYPAVKFHVTEFDDHLWLFNLEVGKDFRNRGLGTAFMKDVQEFCRVVKKPLRLEAVSQCGEQIRLLYFYYGLGFISPTNKMFPLEWKP